ncbi:Aste57867_18607 [Aphanomyces stellatus]|uniref:Aste57867_18607 protein n=1 Tax=Aphanomyces stellatus TaxID=120398 RepID=A0A485LB58_9STRA|nr:hypothetical protein As57867_018545 [Aphanomyces stellatus]VFT95342.1 Aste57867_18607 [Aphanomyces stellatus]
MSKRVPLLKPTGARKPTRGLLIAPKGKPSSQSSNAASQPKTKSSPVDDDAGDGKKRAAASNNDASHHESPKQEAASDRVLRTPRDRKPSKPTDVMRESATEAIQSPVKQPPIRITAPSSQGKDTAAMRINAPRGIIAPGGSFGLPPPPPKLPPPQTPQRTPHSPRHGMTIRIPELNSAEKAATPATRKTPDRKEAKTTTNGAAAAALLDEDDVDNNDEPKPAVRARKTAARSTVASSPRPAKPRAPPRKRKSKGPMASISHKPLKEKFIEFSQSAAPATSASRKRKAKAEEEASSETDADIAGMTMGELAMSVPRGQKADDGGDDDDDDDDEADDDNADGQAPPAQRPRRERSAGAPQVEIINGQIVLVQNSLTVHEDELLHDDDTTSSDHVRLGRGGGGYLSGRRQSKRWSHPETKQFFYCLSQVGTDFTLMETMFPNRSRSELKLKFKTEEKKHRQLVEVALMAANRPLDEDIVALATDKLTKKAREKEEAAAAPQEDSVETGSAVDDFLLI